MKLDVDFNSLRKQLLLLDNQTVTVTVANKQSKKADFDLPNSTLSTLSGSVPKNQALTKKKLRENRGLKASAKVEPNINLHFLAAILDKKAGVFSNAFDNSSNRDVVVVGEELVRGFYDTNDHLREKRIENAALAIVRNPILNRTLKKNGMSVRNSTAWAKKKGFNRFALSTATFFTNIFAEYKRW